MPRGLCLGPPAIAGVRSKQGALHRARVRIGSRSRFNELLELAADDPYESTEYEAMVDFHWGFDCEAEATTFVNALREFAIKPEIVVLRMISGDDAVTSQTLKDERHARH
jgi:hypothetical protein